MEYEVILLQEKRIVGVTARTNNTAPDMGMVIGGLWEKLYSNGMYENIENKINEKAIGVYTEYAQDFKGDYTAAAACEVSDFGKRPEEMKEMLIPAGKYARFIVKGDMHKAVADFWQKLWNIELPRAYTCDFEEYQDGNMDNTEIHIYISLKE